jgi:hypothetical protein
MNPNAIKIDIEDATPEEIERGIVAALVVFATEGTTALEAAAAARQVEALWAGGYYDEQGDYRNPWEGEDLMENQVVLEDLTERQAVIAKVWEAADEAAVEACCAGWPTDKRPPTAWLSLIHEEIWEPKRGPGGGIPLAAWDDEEGYQR